MRLPSRLQGLLDLVPEVASVADIGSGDGVLAAALAERGVRVVATERTPSRVASLRLHLARHGIELDLRRGDGLNALVPGEVELAVVAGMGGRSLVRILETAAWLPPSLLLQPMQEPGVVEAWLRAHGWPARGTTLEQQGRSYGAWLARVPASARRAAA